MLQIPWKTLTAEEQVLNIIKHNTTNVADFGDLKRLLEAGEFHHATYRDIGKCWEGLFFYRRDKEGFRGFSLAGSIAKDSPFMEEAYALVRNTGVSVGSYGNG